MTRAAVILAMVSALCLGTSIGFAVGLLFAHHHMELWPRYAMHGFHGERHGPPGEPSPRAIIPRLTGMLDLSPQQADAIRGEVEASRTEFAQVRDSLHARIERHLTPAQRDRWRTIVRERHPGEPRGRDPHTNRAEPGREGELFR
jgi:hypothetical protein